MKKYNITVKNTAGFQDQGLIYVSNDAKIPDGIYTYEMGKVEGETPKPIMLTKFKNRIKLSKKVIKQILEGI